MSTPNYEHRTFPGGKVTDEQFDETNLIDTDKHIFSLGTLYHLGNMPYIDIPISVNAPLSPMNSF